MFRKVLLFAMFATAAGYCFAAPSLPQIVTSEIYYTGVPVTDQNVAPAQDMGFYEDVYAGTDMPEYVPTTVPAWPIAGSDADVTVSCDGVSECKKNNQDNIKIVAKVGSDLVVENTFNMSARDGTGWSGGANMLHGNQIPVGFDDECGRGSEMPLLHREVLEDDGGNVLAVSRSGRNNCTRRANGYDSYLAKNGLTERTADGDIVTAAGVVGMNADGTISLVSDIVGETEISVDSQEMETIGGDKIRSWVVANGQTLREVLQSWCDKEGWDLVWATSREYPIQASAVFKGRFVDVASAVVRNFGRAIPVPYAKFYKGNRVLVISTTEE